VDPEARSRERALTDGMTWSQYLGALLDELPVLARSITTHTHEHIHELLDGAAHLASRQHLLAMDHVLRTQSTPFSDTLAAALRSQVLESERRHDPKELPVERDALTGQELERARMVGLIDSIAYWELRELRGLCASLRRSRSIGPEQNPLRPEMCARAFLATLETVGFSEVTRILALRVSGSPLAVVLRDFYVQQCRRLAHRDLPIATPSLADRISAVRRPIEGTARCTERRGHRG
jgi:hypothetical protein